MGKKSIDVYNTSNGSQVIMLVGRQRIVRFDLETMKVVKQYAGFTTMIAVAEKTDGKFTLQLH